MKKDRVFIFLLILLAGVHLHFALSTDLYFKVDDFTALAFYKNNGLTTILKDFLVKGDFFGFRKIIGHINYKIMFDVFGANALPYILQNHLLHTLNLILFFVITKHFSKNSLTAFLVSVLYNGLYFFYFSNIHEYLLGTFTLVSILIFLKLPKKKVLSVIFFVLALLTKEVAFSIPFFLFALKPSIKTFKTLKPYWLILGTYILYQAYFLKTGVLLPSNESYFASFSLASFTERLFYFANPYLVALLVIVAFSKKKLQLLPVLLVFFVSLIPNLLLVNKQEMYYLYVPMIYLLVFVATLLPKPTRVNMAIYVTIFYLFGWRQVLPQVARQKFPNWQKESIENVIAKVENEIAANEDVEKIYLDGTNLERDARLMLENEVLNLFVDNSMGQKYNFKYNTNENLINITQK